MKEEIVTDALLREFLLGKVNDRERERIENLFLTDSQTRERVLAAEQELIEDYLDETLSEGEKDRFLSLYAQTDEQQRALRINKSIIDWVVRESRATPGSRAKVSVWSRFRTRLRLKPLFVPALAIILVGIVLVVVWLNGQMEQRKHSAVEEELAQLNSPTSLREVPLQMTSLDLRPGAIRGVEPAIQLDPRTGINIVELRLLWIRNEHYPTYQVEVRRVGDKEPFTLPNLQPENNGTLIRIRLGVNLLKRGQYQVKVRGLAEDSSPGLTEEYSFTLGG
jgi:hypothetical protein